MADGIYLPMKLHMMHSTQPPYRKRFAVIVVMCISFLRPANFTRLSMQSARFDGIFCLMPSNDLRMFIRVFVSTTESIR